LKNKKIQINMDTLLMAYVAAESLPAGTPLYLDDDGDIAYPSEPGSEIPPHFTTIGIAEPGRFPLSNITITEAPDGEWRVAGYSNGFESRKDAIVFALNTLGANLEDLEPFIDHTANTIEHNAFIA